MLGAGKDNATPPTKQCKGLWIAVAAGIVFAAICFAFAPQLLRLLQASDDVEKFGVRYLRVSVFGFPAMLLVMAGVGYLRGLKDTKRPLYIALGTATGNLFLELFLVFGLGFGVGASALSTVVFQWVGAGFYLWWIGHAASEHDVGWRPDGVAYASVGSRRRFAVHTHDSRSGSVIHCCGSVRCSERRSVARGARDREPTLLLRGAGVGRDRHCRPGNGWHLVGS